MTGPHSPAERVLHLLIRLLIGLLCLTLPATLINAAIGLLTQVTP